MSVKKSVEGREMRVERVKTELRKGGLTELGKLTGLLQQSVSVPPSFQISIFEFSSFGARYPISPIGPKSNFTGLSLFDRKR